MAEQIFFSLSIVSAPQVIATVAKAVSFDLGATRTFSVAGSIGGAAVFTLEK